MQHRQAAEALPPFVSKIQGLETKGLRSRPAVQHTEY